MNRWRHRALLATTVLALTGACKVRLTPENVGRIVQGAIDANRDLTPENEYYVGRSVATTIMARHDYKIRDARALAAGDLRGLTEYVGQVGAVVAFAALETTRKGDREAPLAGWHFVVLESDAINAFAAPGGFIFVTRGAVANAESEDELAAVLAHEVAHVRRGHALGSIKKSRWAGVAKDALSTTVELDGAALAGLTQAFEGAMEDMTDALIVKGYSRDTEFEADRVGLDILTRAGYDPRAFVSYLKKLDERQDTGGGGFRATHPKASDRIARLESLVAALPEGTAPKARVKRFARATEGL